MQTAAPLQYNSALSRLCGAQCPLYLSCAPDSIHVSRTACSRQAPGLTPRTIETDRRWSILSLLCLISRCTPIRQYSVGSIQSQNRSETSIPSLPRLMLSQPWPADHRLNLFAFVLLWYFHIFYIEIFQELAGIPVAPCPMKQCQSVFMAFAHISEVRFVQLPKCAVFLGNPIGQSSLPVGFIPGERIRNFSLLGFRAV